MRKIKQSAIYKIYNLIDGKFYIGSAIDFAARIRSHLSLLRRNSHTNKHFQNAWNLYKEENFRIDIIEEVPIFENETRESFKVRLVDEREQYYLNTLLFADQKDRRFYELGYNKNRIASSALGRKLSDESKKKLSESHKGIKASKETRDKMSVAHKGEKNAFFGKSHTEEVKIKISNANKGKLMTNEFKNKISKAFSKPVIQFTIDLKKIKRWNSVHEAETSLQITHISAVCRKERKTAGKYYWEYEKN